MPLSAAQALALGFVVTGSVNTISLKLADRQKAETLEGERDEFNHPFVQALVMFMGEASCLLFFYLMQPKRPAADDSALASDKQGGSFPKIILLPPALCDMTATSLMYVGLTWTYPSVYQMMRGAIIIFTGVLSVLFLNKRLRPFEWAGMVLVLVGLGLVGLASVIDPAKDSSAPHPLAGDIVVVAAQLVSAVQMVYEEKVLRKYEVAPLQVVGLEGLFGFCALSLLLVPFYFLPGYTTGGRLENTPDALHQMRGNGIIPLALAGNFFSIAFFNYFGVSITKVISATTRTVLDSLRTIVVWGFSLAVAWERPSARGAAIEVAGFVVLLLGTAIYNRVLVVAALKPREEHAKAPPADGGGYQVLTDLDDPTAARS